MAFSESFLQELADRNEITDVVGSYVRLTRRSGSNQFGLCPFHSEKTPSFSVSADKQIYHCFGCGKGGSVINFIMEIENLTFPDAVEFLARRAGMEVPDDRPDENRRRRERMLALNRDAARFFFSRLTAPGGRPAQDYILRRRISPATAKAFGLGFAPDSWDALCSAMKARGYSEYELTDAGLARHGKSGRGIYDTFRNRLMFPVIDVRGNVIGFSGRILDDGEPKYMNSPETLVFNKSLNLFALNLAKKSKSGYIILSEGNIDVVALHQAGFDSAVASLGTSLTPEQARLISRYAGEVIIAYDSDGAGQKASQRAIGILEKLDLKVRVLQLPEGKDPDEFIKLKGAEAFRSLLENTSNHIEYRLQRVRGQFDLSVDEQKIECLKRSSEIIAELPSPVERQVYSARLAGQTGVSAAVVADEVERTRKKLLSRSRKQFERESTRPARPAAGTPRYENLRSARAEEGLIRLYYLDPSLFDGAEIAPEEFSSDVLARFFSVLRAKAAGHTQLSMAALAESFSGEEMSLLTNILNDPSVPDSQPNRRRAMEDYIEIIKDEKQGGSAGDDLIALARQMRNKNRKRYGG